MRKVVLNPSTFNYISYATDGQPSNGVFVVSLHGSAEGGPIDGSLITKVEGYGYAKRWNQGERYPFTLIVPQGIRNPGDDISSFKNVMNNLEPELLRLGAKVIVYIGWSQGASIAIATLGMTETNNMFTQSKITLVSAVIGIAGKGSGSMDYSKCLDVPFLLVHGDSDTANNVSGSKTIYNKVTECQPDRKHPVELIIIPGSGHSDAMNRAYNRTDPTGKRVYDLINSLSGGSIPVPTKDPVIESYLLDSILYVKTQSGKLLKIPYTQ